MEGQLFEEIKVKQEERLELYDDIKAKESRIKQLEEAADFRLEEKLENNHNSHHNHSSHISTGSQQRQSLKSQSSLKYSAQSHNYSKVLRRSTVNKDNSNDERIIDLELSEAGSEFYDVDQHVKDAGSIKPTVNSSEYIYTEQPSCISNVSDLFMREEELPAEKMHKINKIKRADQLKLFEKTSSYIKSLKGAISEKDKRIKLLQKKIDSLKSSELVRK